MLRALRWLLLAAAVLYGAVCLVAFLAQRRLLYFPERYPEEAALRAAARRGLSPWRDGAGALLGWRAAPGGASRSRTAPGTTGWRSGRTRGPGTSG